MNNIYGALGILNSIVAIGSFYYGMWFAGACYAVATVMLAHMWCEGRPIVTAVIIYCRALIWIEDQWFRVKVRWLLWRHDRRMRKMGYRGP